MLNNQKTWVVYLLLVINTLIFFTYTILDLLEIKMIDSVDFTLLIIYIIVTFIVGTELIHERNQENNKRNN